MKIPLALIVLFLSGNYLKNTDFPSFIKKTHYSSLISTGEMSISLDPIFF